METAVMETAVGADFAPTKSSSVRTSSRDLVAGQKSLVRNSGLGVGVKTRSSFKTSTFDITQSVGDLQITSTSIERQQLSQNLAPVLVIISGDSLVLSRKILPVLVFTGAAPLARQHQ